MTIVKREEKVSKKQGFTLIEALISAAVFAVVAISVYQAYAKVLEATNISKVKIAAVALANEQIEIMRNLQYTDVGIVGGLPSGKIQHTQPITRNNIPFQVTTTIRNVDDPFDGSIGGSPNDLSPADYKLAQVDIACTSCKSFQPLSFSTYIAPRALETSGSNGALFVKVFDANGAVIPGANVHISNTSVNPNITIDDVTNNDGVLQIVDAPPGQKTYSVTATKSGYSTDQTYSQSGTQVSTKPNFSVVTGALTQSSLSIDLASSINVSSVSSACTPVGGIDYATKGVKQSYTSPVTYKYNTNRTTNGAGTDTLSGLEWDTYTTALTGTAYDIAGTIPLMPIALAPGANQDLKLIVTPKNGRSVMVTIKDGATGLPISDASVELSKSGYDTILTTGRGFLTQTDWSGGSGQAAFTDPTKYFSSDGNVAASSGDMKLRKSGTKYVTPGSFISSTFDTGASSNFYQLYIQPVSQTSGTDLKFQIATNNDNTTWDFTGPDGTVSTYYTATNANIHASNNGNRYLRYKAYLSTTNTNNTPTLSDLSFTFSSLCASPGQVIFGSLASGTYNLTVTKTGYQTYTGTNVVTTPSATPDWQEKIINITPS